MNQSGSEQTIARTETEETRKKSFMSSWSSGSNLSSSYSLTDSADSHFDESYAPTGSLWTGICWELSVEVLCGVNPALRIPSHLMRAQLGFLRSEPGTPQFPSHLMSSHLGFFSKSTFPPPLWRCQAMCRNQRTHTLGMDCRTQRRRFAFQR